VGRRDPAVGEGWGGGEVEMLADTPVADVGIRCSVVLASPQNLI
jgi:hypothetical protein